MNDKTVYVQTYGCTSNHADSQTMMGLLDKAGYKITSNETEANYLLINTCGVKAQTEEKIISRLRSLRKSGKKIIIGGCLTKINPERIKKAVPDFAGMLDTRSIGKVVDVFDQIDSGQQNLVRISNVPEEKPALPRLSFSKVIDIIKLSEGCLSNCSFCATKLSRGNLYSFRPDSIRDAVKLGLQEGKKEFYLASEDSSAYGRDIGTNLAELLNSITDINGEFFVRVGMMNPLHFKKVEMEGLIEAYKNEKVFKFLHLCVQSGSDNVLNAMKRGYSAKDFLCYVKKFREAIPELTLSTDIIVGHPGETEEDFLKTAKLIGQVMPDMVNISGYGVRKGTASAEMKQIASQTKKDRTRKLTEIAKKIALEKNRNWIGWKGSVLVDEYNEAKGNFIGRNYAYKTVVLAGRHTLGDTVEVEIVDAMETHLKISDTTGRTALQRC